MKFSDDPLDFENPHHLTYAEVVLDFENPHHLTYAEVMMNLLDRNMERGMYSMFSRLEAKVGYKMRLTPEEYDIYNRGLRHRDMLDKWPALY